MNENQKISEGAKEDRKAYFREWRKNNPEKVKEYNKRQYERRKQIVQKWISVSDRLPEAGIHERFLVTIRHKNPQKPAPHIDIYWYDSTDDDPKYWGWEGLDGWGGVVYVSHWMTLPTPPEVNE